jgi:hypothetical protein
MRNIGRHLALLVVAGVLTAIVYGLQPASMLEFVLASVWNTMATYGLYGTLARVAAARRLHGSAYAARSSQIWQVFRSTKLALEMRVYASRVIAGGIILVGIAILSGRAPLLLLVAAAFFTVQWLLFRVAAASLPPALVMLGSSSPSVGQALHDFRAALSPLRVVSLLDVDEAGPSHDPDRLDNFRTSDDADWQTVFAVVRSAARVILLDARVDTAALRFEAQAIVASSSTGQKIIVVKQDGRAALIEHLDPDARDFLDRHATFVEPDKAYDATEQALAKRRETQDRPTRI